MTDPLDAIEAKLARLRPRILPDQLVGQIEMRLAAPAPPRWADRILLFAIGSGAAAACVIVAILFVDSATSRTIGPPPAAVATASSHAADDPPAAFARADLAKSIASHDVEP